jgi:hypothetical protein
MRNDDLRFVHGPLARRGMFGHGRRRGRPWGRWVLIALLVTGGIGAAWLSTGQGVAGTWSAIAALWYGRAEGDSLPVPDIAAPVSDAPLPASPSGDGDSHYLPLPPLPPGR